MAVYDRPAQKWCIHACVITGFHCVMNAVVAAAGAAWVADDEVKLAPASVGANIGVTPSRAGVAASTSCSAAICGEDSSVVAPVPSVPSPVDCGF